MMTYLLQLSLIWLFGFLFIRFWLGREKLPAVKRIAILSTILMGLLIPLLPLSDWIGNLIAGDKPAVLLPDFVSTILLPEITIGATNNNDQGHSLPVWLIIWLAGALLVLARLLWGWLQIARIYRQTSSAELFSRPVRILEASNSLPFSYGPLLFWPKNTDPNSGEWLPIWHHECAHIDQGHTYDLLLIDMLSVVLWWNPLLWAFRSMLRFQHELLADEAASATTRFDKENYMNLLLLPRSQNKYPIKAHAFHQNFIKKRIHMLSQTKGSIQKCWAAILLIPILVFACGQIQEDQAETEPDLSTEASLNDYAFRTSIDTVITFDPDTYEESMEIVESVVYSEAEYYPVYGNCYDVLDDPEAAHTCSFNNLMQEITNHLEYPTEAKDLGIEGTTFINLYAPASGSRVSGWLKTSSIEQVENKSVLTDAERAAYKALDDAAMAAWNAIPKDVYIPARIGDETVTMELLLPIKFALD